MRYLAITVCLLWAALLTPACSHLQKQPDTPRLTQAHTPREGQKLWFSPLQTEEAVRVVAACISASEMATDFQRARKAYADYLRTCYATFSEQGRDSDGGVRALNLIRQLHRAADGSARLWQAAVDLAKDTQDQTLPGLPIPAAY